MKISKTEKYTLIKPEAEIISEFVKNFKMEANSFNDENLIIDFSEKFNTDFINLNVFLPINQQHKQNGTSFVIVIKADFDEDFLDEMDIVPTITEAEDIVDLDAISKDLGF